MDAVSGEDALGERLLVEVDALKSEVERLARVAADERHLLLAVLEASPYGIIISDPHGRLVLQNAASQSIWRGRANTAAVEDWAQFRAFHPDGTPYVGNDWSMARALSERRTTPGEEIRIQRFDHSFGTLLGSSAPIISPSGELRGAIAIFVDITRSKEIEQALRESERRQRFVAQASAILAGSQEYEKTFPELAALAAREFAEVCIIDLITRGSQLERIALARRGHSAAEAAESLGRTSPHAESMSAIASVLRSGVSTFMPNLSEDEADSVWDGARTKAASTANLASLIVTPLSARGQLLGALTLARTPKCPLFGRDDLEVAEDLARRAATAVDNARLFQEAQWANKTKDEFFAILSHELRTPMHAILGWSKLLRAKALDEAEIDRALETIERSVKTQAEQIEELLDVSRIITGKLRLDASTIDPYIAVSAALDTVRLAAETKGVRLMANLDRTVGLIVGDQRRLQQIVWNLVSNAIEYTPSGGRVDVELRRAEDQVEISVHDNGRGIASEALPLIFDRFRRGDTRDSRQHGGLGLGLTIVRHLVELHGGTVRAESAGVGKGAQFTVRLPLGTVSHAMIEEALRATSPEARSFERSSRLRGLRVLVVDDEGDSRDLICAILEQSGATATAVESAEEALSLLKDYRADVLLSDIGMKGMNGYALIRELRSWPPDRGGRTPAAALTAHAKEEDRRMALQAGYHEHLPKPVDPTELVDLVAKLATGAATAS